MEQVQDSDQSARAARRWTRPRFLIPALAGVLVLACLAVLLVAGWIFSSVLRDDALEPDHGLDEMELIIEAVEPDAITLRPLEGSDDERWTRDGRYGLDWEGGWGFAGPIRELDEERVVLDFEPLEGSPPVGAEARLDSFTFPGDPLTALAIPFDDVVIPGELGDLPAWQVAGDSDTWVIFVHGRDAPRREALRMLSVVHSLNLPAMVISYRNDEDAPASDDGYHRYGATEWRDLESAAAYALDSGAARIVLVGYSMGGAVSLSFIENSALATNVAGLILDAPLLSFEAAVDFGADDRGIRGFITSVAKRVSSWRFDIDWDDVDYSETAQGLEVPVLLFHGDADDTAPIAESDALAEARPDVVTYIRAEGAGHVEAWNSDPPRYEAAVTDFLRQFLGQP